MKIDKVLKLARIEINPEEKEQLEKDFSSILNFIKEIEKVDISRVKAMSYPQEIYNVMREDVIDQTIEDKKKTAKKLINLAPEKKDNYLKVKKVL